MRLVDKVLCTFPCVVLCLFVILTQRLTLYSSVTVNPVEIKISRTLVQDERVFNNVFVFSKFHEDVFWVDKTRGSFDSFKTRPILRKDFPCTIVEIFYFCVLECVFEIRNTS